jgi:hypothetical protein
MRILPSNNRYPRVYMCLAAALRAAVSATVAGSVLSTSHADLVATGAHRGSWLLHILVRYAIEVLGAQIDILAAGLRRYRY